MSDAPLDLEPIKARLAELPFNAYDLSIRNEVAEDTAALIAEVERLRMWAGVLLDAIDRMS